MCKDALVQAAGRMRNLGGQTLRLVAPPEVDAMLREAGGVARGESVQVRHVLQYAVASSVRAAEAGLLLWARQGFHAIATRAQPDMVLQDERLALDDLYARADVAQPVSNALGVVRVAWAQSLARSGEATPFAEAPEAAAAEAPAPPPSALAAQEPESGRQLLLRLDEQIVVLGGDVQCRAGGQEEQCERETEQEVLREEQQAREEQRVEAAREADWDVAIALSAKAPADIAAQQGGVTVRPLGQVVADLAPPLALGLERGLSPRPRPQRALRPLSTPSSLRRGTMRARARTLRPRAARCAASSAAAARPTRHLLRPPRPRGGPPRLALALERPRALHTTPAGQAPSAARTARARA
jgi:hypothetical protein